MCELKLILIKVTCNGIFWDAYLKSDKTLALKQFPTIKGAFAVTTGMIMKNLARKCKNSARCASDIGLYNYDANIFYYSMFVWPKLTTGWRLRFTYLLFTTNLVHGHAIQINKAQSSCKTPSPLKYEGLQTSHLASCSKTTSSAPLLTFSNVP